MWDYWYLTFPPYSAITVHSNPSSQQGDFTYPAFNWVQPFLDCPIRNDNHTTIAHTVSNPILDMVVCNNPLCLDPNKWSTLSTLT